MKNILLLITTQRCGSTWLFDMLRVHPHIHVSTEARVFRLLKLNGNRFPRDLSDTGINSRLIENRLPRQRFSVHDLINPLKHMNFLLDNLYTSRRLIRIEDIQLRDTKSTHPVEFSIDKIHPSFFLFNTGNILEMMAKCEKEGYRFKLVFMVRDPIASMTSHRNYQKRNPSWYRGFGNEKLIKNYFQSYQSILTLIEKKSGLIVDYKELRTETTSLLMSIFKYLWGEELDENNLDTIIQEAIRITNRNRKQKKATPFLSDQPGTISGSDEANAFFFDQNKEKIESCYIVYKQLINYFKNKSA